MARLEAIETELRRARNRLAKAEITPLPTPVMDSLHNSVRFLNAQQARLEQTLHDHIDRHPRRQQDRQLLASIPAVGPKTAWRMRAALDMAVVVATQHNPAIQCLYQRLVARGKSKMSALRAALAFAPQLPWRAQTSNPLSATIRLKTLDR